METHRHPYTIEAMYGKDIDVMVEVCHDYSPETNTYPGHNEWWIENVYKNGRLVEWDVLVRYFSILHGCYMNEENIEEIILDHIEANRQDQM